MRQRNTFSCRGNNELYSFSILQIPISFLRVCFFSWCLCVPFVCLLPFLGWCYFSHSPTIRSKSNRRLSAQQPEYTWPSVVIFHSGICWCSLIQHLVRTNNHTNIVHKEKRNRKERKTHAIAWYQDYQVVLILLLLLFFLIFLLFFFFLLFLCVCHSFSANPNGKIRMW